MVREAWYKTMSAPQIIRSPSGEELVVLPRAEYEALLERAHYEAEDADDAAIYDARKAGLAAGAAALPPEVSAAILRGDSRLKAIRKWRGETQLHLEAITGIGQGYLSDLENGRRAGTPETIAKLAEALNVPVEWLSYAWPVVIAALAGGGAAIGGIGNDACVVHYDFDLSEVWCDRSNRQGTNCRIDLRIWESVCVLS